MTIIALLSLAAFGVAGLLFWWTAGFDTEPASLPPSVFYSLAPSLPQTPVHGNVQSFRVDTTEFRPITAGPQPLTNHTPVRRRGAGQDDAETVRFVRPWDFPVQFFPGRLEVLEGTTPHKEIRFLRVPGELPHVILGRELGLTPHYIGLGSPTVSRQHARLDFADNRWTVKNLSRTNPLVINDHELSDTEVARPLADGDKLELGDVVLRFHVQ